MDTNLETFLTNALPRELVDHIKIYTGEVYWRNGKIYKVKKIDKTDHRYTILRNMPKIKQVHNESFEHRKRGLVWFKLENGKHVTISVGYKRVWYGAARVDGHFWELQYNQTCLNQLIGI
jgi:hypothetical protein